MMVNHKENNGSIMILLLLNLHLSREDERVFKLQELLILWTPINLLCPECQSSKTCNYLPIAKTAIFLFVLETLHGPKFNADLYFVRLDWKNWTFKRNTVALNMTKSMIRYDFMWIKTVERSTKFIDSPPHSPPPPAPIFSFRLQAKSSNHQFIIQWKWIQGTLGKNR